MRVRQNIQLFKLLSHFEIVVKMGQRTLAAEALGMQPSNLSEEMHLLEDLLGTPLFIRKGHSFSLTENGQLLYRKTQTLSTEVEAISNLFSKKDNTGRNIHIAMPTSCMNLFQTYYLKACRKVAPQCKYSIHSIEPLHDSQLENLDICITYNPALVPDGVDLATVESHFVFVTTAQYIEEHGLPKDELDLLENHHFCLSTDTVLYDPLYTEKSSSAKFIDFSVPTLEAQISLIKSEHLIGLIPSLAIQQLSDLVEVKCPEIESALTVHLMVRKKALKDKLVMEMCKSIVALWKEFQPYDNMWISSVLSQFIKQNP